MKLERLKDTRTIRSIPELLKNRISNKKYNIPPRASIESDYESNMNQDSKIINQKNLSLNEPRTSQHNYYSNDEKIEARSQFSSYNNDLNKSPTNINPSMHPYNQHTPTRDNSSISQRYLNKYNYIQPFNTNHASYQSKNINNL